MKKAKKKKKKKVVKVTIIVQNQLGMFLIVLTSGEFDPAEPIPPFGLTVFPSFA